MDQPSCASLVDRHLEQESAPALAHRVRRDGVDGDAPLEALLVGLVVAMALLTKLTVPFFCLTVALALLITPARRYLRTPWPWLAAGLAVVGLLPERAQMAHADCHADSSRMITQSRGGLVRQAMGRRG